ncbi:MAG: YlxR family protein [Lachnospiraceae bacterium]|nr:YlxR family protein [Lachnospiraceae bacterium]
MAKQIPNRQCIGCREMKPKIELVRVIRTPEGDICLDKTGKKNGRGAYICQNSECFNKAKKSKGIERALKVSIPDEIYDAISKELI